MDTTAEKGHEISVPFTIPAKKKKVYQEVNLTHDMKVLYNENEKTQKK